MKSVRLPSFVIPIRYRLTIKPDLAGFIFGGEETIEIGLEKPVKKITLHAKDLKISDVTYMNHRGKVSYNKKAETATFSFSKNLPKGNGELKLKFQGVLNNKMRGFYRSRYMHEGKEKHMATTQFEATDARMAFPCFDEPAQKAVFDVTVIVPKELTVISNTIESEVTEKGGLKTVTFEPTPRMSTYLLAFIIGDFEFIGGKTKDGVQVRVFVTPGKKHQAKFALDTAIKTLEFYNNYFDIPYPLPVMDLIAIPDFSHGAMENWGAVTYRETALLVDPEHSSASNKQWVALVIAHELAHQWFGNLVTMEWWTHLWLNEGFASYIEYLAVDHLFPSWDIWTQFAFNDMGIALKLDALKHTHPIEIEVRHPDEIGEIFDEISYSKGSSVIRMLAGYLGEKNFRDGLRHYLKKHSYKNASTVHLWEAFEKISKKPVRKLMQNWTGSAGYPMIRVIEEPKHLLLKQSRYFSSPISKKAAKDETVWQVPISATGDGAKVTSYLLTEKETRINKPKGKWIKLNLDESGFYRTDYPAQMLQALQSPVKAKKLHALDRLALVRDGFALAESGDLPTTQALELIKGYTDETDYTVWVEIASGLAQIRNLIYGQKFYGKFEIFAQGIFEKIGKKVGFKSETGEAHTHSLLRSLILQQLIGYSHKPTIEHALKIFKQNKSVSADLRSTVYSAVAQAGSEKEHKVFSERYISESLSEEQARLGRALGQFADEELLRKTLEFALSKNVRIQDTAQFFASVWVNPKGSKIAWEYSKKHWSELLHRYPSSGHILNRFIKPASVFNTAKQAKEVTAFFKTHKAPGAERAIQQVLERIYSNDAWLLRDAEKIGHWLSVQ